MYVALAGVKLCIKIIVFALPLGDCLLKGAFLLLETAGDAQLTLGLDLRQ